MGSRKHAFLSHLTDYLPRCTRYYTINVTLVDWNTCATILRQSYRQTSCFLTHAMMDGSKEGETTSSFNKTKEVNRTYVISALPKCGENTFKTPSSGVRLTLQRKPSSRTTANHHEETTQENHRGEKRLTLQRRTRTGSINRTKVLTEPNPARETHETIKTPGKTSWGAQKTSSEKVSATHEEGKTVSTPTRRTQFEKLSVKRDVFERLTGKDAFRPTTAARQKPPQMSTDTMRSTCGERVQIGGLNRHMTPSAQVRRPPALMSSTAHGGTSASRAAHAEGHAPLEAVSRTRAPRPQELKMENSAVTVAVRVRPFSSR